MAGGTMLGATRHFFISCDGGHALLREPHVLQDHRLFAVFTTVHTQNHRVAARLHGRQHTARCDRECRRALLAAATAATKAAAAETAAAGVALGVGAFAPRLHRPAHGV